MKLPGDRALALILACVAAFFVYWTWGGLDRPGLYHDEKAYVLQARIYADLKLAEPSPPVPSLWEQVHVFVEPHYASKYPPGFPAVLALGAAFNEPGLVPLLLTAATAALLFLFGSRIVGKWTAFVATALWLAAPVNTKWRAAYFSESLTGLLWVSWMYFAWRYRREGRTRDLVITSLLVAFAGITRPATAIALVIPVPFIVWPRLRDAEGRRSAMTAIGAGLVICAAVPFWNHAVLDSWTKFPYSEYSVRTFPFDMPKWHIDWSPASRVLPPDIQSLGEAQRLSYEARALDSLPATFFSRLNQLGIAALPPDFAPLRYLAPIGLLAAGSAGIVALASAVLILLAYLLIPQPPTWTIYCLEVFPVVAFGIAVALRRAVEFAAPRIRLVGAASPHLPVAAFIGALALLGGGATRWRPERVDDHSWMRREVYFRAGVCALPAGKKIVFVQPRPVPSPHHILVDNDPRWEKSDTWIVRAWDTPRQRALLDAAPDRAAYYYDEKAGWFARMNRDGTPTREGVVNVLRVNLDAGRSLECAGS